MARYKASIYCHNWCLDNETETACPQVILLTKFIRITFD